MAPLVLPVPDTVKPKPDFSTAEPALNEPMLSAPCSASASSVVLAVAEVSVTGPVSASTSMLAAVLVSVPALSPVPAVRSTVP